MVWTFPQKLGMPTERRTWSTLNHPNLMVYQSWKRSFGSLRPGVFQKKDFSFASGSTERTTRAEKGRADAPSRRNGRKPSIPVQPVLPSAVSILPCDTPRGRRPVAGPVGARMPRGRSRQFNCRSNAAALSGRPSAASACARSRIRLARLRSRFSASPSASHAAASSPRSRRRNARRA